VGFPEVFQVMSSRLKIEISLGAGGQEGALLRLIYGKAHVPGVKVNPCLGVQVTVPKGKRDRWLTDEELMTFFRTLPRMDDPKAADCYLLMLSSLCRPNEAASARAEDIILINGERVWRIPDTKNGRDFLMPLQGSIAEILLRRLMEVGGKGPLFWKYNADRDYPEQLKKANRNSARGRFAPSPCPGPRLQPQRTGRLYGDARACLTLTVPASRRALRASWSFPRASRSPALPPAPPTPKPQRSPPGVPRGVLYDPRPLARPRDDLRELSTPRHASGPRSLRSRRQTLLPSLDRSNFTSRSLLLDAHRRHSSLLAVDKR
jgi:hypothetical protein